MASLCPELLPDLLAAYGPYINPFKLLGFVLAFSLWALFAAWVDKDTIAVNTFRDLWNLIALGTGAAALVLGMLLVPLFWLGFLIFCVLNLTVAIVYVVHRNKLVRAEDTVCTMAHFKRLQEQGLSGKKKQKEVTERVRLQDAQRKVVAIPEGDEEREQYRLVQDLVFDALWRRASLAEVVPAKETAKISYEVDGEPVEREPLVRQEADAVVQFIKQIAGLNMEERRKPQTGWITATIGENKHKVQVRTDGSTAGEKLTLRILHNEETLKVPDLGFNPPQYDAVMALREITPGLILLSAPARQGLTTTIYSFMRTHDRFLQNVQAIEFEKELDIDNVTQTVFAPAEGKTFTEGLLKLVRSDPDIIVLPELRERESAVVAAQAAAQKQKVYVGMLATDLFDALRKWITLVGDKKLVARGLLAVSNQRLVRVLCRECKEAYKPDAQMMRKLNLPADKALYRKPEPQYDKHGHEIICQACQGTGYVGRTAVFDWLTVDDGLREVIRRSTAMSDIQSYITKKGGLGLQAQGLQKVLEGVTSIQEIARALRQGDGPAGPRPRPQPPAGGGRPGPAKGK